MLVEQVRALQPSTVGHETYQAIAAIASPDALRAPDLDIEAARTQAERALFTRLPNGGTQ